MASDNFDMDWGDDPFAGDIDFDMDFDMDPFKGKGFIRSLTTGFLQGAVDETLGSGAARMRTLRTILPSSYSNALDKLSFVSSRVDDLVREFKEENAESAKSLQSIASHLNQRMGSKLPGFAQNALGNFSDKDFSMWERLDPENPNFKTRIDGVNEDDVDQAIDASVMAQSSMFASLGESINSMAASVGGQLSATIGAGNRQLVNIEGGIRDLLSYQRNVQAKLDQAQLNLMARSYVQDAKFYKFMEAGIHAEVAELKRIVQYTKLSDFEKTSNLTASKAYMRNSVFNAVGKRVGGITGMLRDRFNTDSRKETYGVVGDLLGNLADGLEMGSDVGFSRGLLGNIIGKMVAGVAVDQLPYFFTRGPGKRAVDSLIRKYPEQGAFIKDQIAKVTDMGNTVSHIAMSGTGIANYMADNWQPLDEMRFYDYEEYVDSLPPGRKPLPKAVWAAKNAAENKAKQSLNRLMSETTRSRGTQYTINRRNPKDLDKPGIWKEMNNITLNEVLPGLISQTNLILEKMRTGRDDVESVGYNYTRGQFQKDSDRRISVASDLMPHSEFRSFTSAALNMVDSLDPDKMLSPGARKALAKQIVVDVDKEYGFQPLYYLGDIPGVSPENLKEIHAVMKRHFGITDSEVQQFQSGDGMTRTKMLGRLGTAEGRERLNAASSQAQDLKANIPNIAERINLLRATGNEQMLRDLGVIYTDNGIDRINIQAFHDRIGQYMDNPDNPVLKGATPSGNGPTPTLGGLRAGAGPTVNPYEDLNNTLGTLNERLSNLDQLRSSTTVNWDSQSGVFSDIKTSNQGILDKTTEMSMLLTTLLDLAKAGKLFSGAPGPREERQEETAKRSVLDRVKKLVPENILGRSAEFLMKNNPLILGGLLGGVASSFMQNPIMAASVAGLGLLGGAYLQHRQKSGAAPDGDMPSDDEDIIDESGEPILKASKLRMGDYMDMATKKIIKTWEDIRGPIMDVTTKTVIGARELAGKIFGPDGRAVALKGLRAVRDAAVGAYNLVNPMDRIRSTIQMGKEFMYQQDVYLKSDLKNPVLRASKFKAGDYFVRDDNGSFKPISGWNEIDGAVYDNQGNQLVSEEEYQSGLVTASGAAVRNVGGMAANMVGGAAGLVKSGINNLLGRFGYTQGPNAGPGGNGPNKTGPNGVERRLDKIYRLLCKQFDIPGEVDPDEPLGVTGEPSTGGMRLNSLAWKEKEAEKKEKHRVNEAIINISETLGGSKDEKGPKKEGNGLFDKLKGLIMGAGGFAVKLFKNPLGAIGDVLGGLGKFAIGTTAASIKRLGKIGTALFSGVLGLASPIYKLLKTGFVKLAQAFVMGKAAGGGLKGLLGRGSPVDDLDVEQRGQAGKRKNGKVGKAGKVARGGRLARMGRMAFGSPTTAIGSYLLADMFGDDTQDATPTSGADVGIGERDSVTGHYRTQGDAVVDTLTSWLPSGMLAKAAADSLPMDKETRESANNYGIFWSSDKKFFFKRDEMEAWEDKINGISKTADGYGELKPQYATQPRAVRFAMYGCSDQQSSFGRRIGWLEQVLYPYVTIRDNRASLKNDTPIEKILTDFLNSDTGSNRDAGAVQTWFIARFKPVFLVSNAAVSVAKMGDLESFDNAKGYEVVQVLERVQQTLNTFSPNPFTIDVRVDSKYGTMGPESTRHKIDAVLKDMEKTYPKPPMAVEKIAPTVEAQAKAQAPGTPKETGPSADIIAQDAMSKIAAKASMDDIAKRFSQPEQVKTIDISDLMPGGDQEMDPFVMTRLAVYGNIDNMPWRVEAVLRLERYVESYIMVIGDQARFTGKSSQLLELFKPAFRISNQLSEMNWLTWFRDRFLPTLMTYTVEVKKLTGVIPSRGWKQLSATNRAKIARKLTEQMVTVDQQLKTVWEIAASPFPNSTSGKWSDRADKYLKILDVKAQEARLKDPELEEEKSRGTSGDDPVQLAQAARNKQVAQSAIQEVFGGNKGIGGSSFTPSMSGVRTGGPTSVYPNPTMSIEGGGAGSAGQFMGKPDANFNPEFLKKAGEDKGIKMSPEQGEKLMLNHLLKAGITDVKTIALALAMVKKETGNYQNTVENTNWSAPTLLKYFKNIPDAATAQKVAAMSPPERAMWVYGRAPKGPQLGNQSPEDGWKYRGRGFFQLTGKANYERFKKETGIDVVNNPQLVSEDPNVMAESAVRFLKNNKAMLSIAKTGDFDTAVRGINGGNSVPATDERRQYYQEYLNKLRNGDLALDGAEAEQAASTPPAPTDQPPAAADKGAPAGSPAIDTPIATPVGQNTVPDLLKADAQKSAPSNAGTPPPMQTASTFDSGVVAGDDNDGPVNTVNSSVPSKGQPSAPTSSSGPTASKPASVKEAAKPVDKQAEVKATPAPAMPDHINTTDATAASQLAIANQTLNKIAQLLERSQSNQPTVRMN
ncbi:peptidoglycan hydrolase [Serratia phage vB_SmaM-Yubaba]|nr:peptidoglycan hydrolase [Serratia phage vB_SmaM-Yubaba]